VLLKNLRDEALEQLVASSEKPKAGEQGYCAYCESVVHDGICGICKSAEYVVKGTSTLAQLQQSFDTAGMSALIKQLHLRR
jgi:hypothetical protein